MPKKIHFFYLIILITIFIQIKTQKKKTTEEKLGEVVQEIIDTYDKEILPRFEEITEIKNNGTQVSKWNFIFQLKYYFFKIHKVKIEGWVKLLKNKKVSSIITVKNTKLDKIKKEQKDFFNYYKELKETINKTHKLYNEGKDLLFYCLKIVLIVLVIIAFIAIVIIVYVVKYMNYQPLLQNEDESTKNKTISKIVKIANTLNLSSNLDKVGKSD